MGINWIPTIVDCTKGLSLDLISPRLLSMLCECHPDQIRIAPTERYEGSVWGVDDRFA
jgi:hypothetical protein